MRKNDAKIAKQGIEPLRKMIGQPVGGQGSYIMAADFVKKLGGEPKKKSKKAWEKANPQGVELLRNADLEFGNKRGDKPFFLPVPSQRALYALARIISKDRNEDDIKEAISDPRNPNKHPIREVNIADLSRVIYGSAMEMYRRMTFDALRTLAGTYQLNKWIDGGKEKFEIIPILTLQAIGGTMQQGSPLIEKVRIQFGKLFFERFESRYALIPEKIFEVLQRNHTSIIATLLAYFNGCYATNYEAAQRERRRIKKEAKENAKMGIMITEEELLRRQDEAAREKMKVPLLAQTIKEMIGGAANYSETTEQSRRFWTDLARAIKDLKEIFLIDEAVRVEGTDKIFFFLSENYHRKNSEGTITPL